MTKQIEIHEHNTANTGVYKVWGIHNGKNVCRLVSEAHVNSLLNMRQKEAFFMGKWKFKIPQCDFDRLFDGYLYPYIKNPINQLL